MTVAAGDMAEQFRLLAEHHRECEHAGDELATVVRTLIPLYDNAALRARAERALRQWNEHQWPDLNKEASNG